MPYYTRVLQPDEKVLIVGRLHWWIYGRGVLLLAIGIALLVFAFWLIDPDWQRVVRIAGGAFGAVGLLLLLGAWIRRHATEIVVTDRRVILKRGVLSRHTAEMNVSKIETVDVEQGLGGRIWGYGTLLIRGTGSGFEPLVGVGSPIAIRNAIVVG
jgi:membrane protein YdbS with pleckstrin-like domain